jgi:mannose-6-phosphate isomerase-like protein (cupin superfamily)
MNTTHEALITPEQQLYQALADWKNHLASLPEGYVSAVAGIDPEETPDGDIFPLDSLFDTDAAIVDMAKVSGGPNKTDTPHKHINDELEGHLIVRGSADFYVKTADGFSMVPLVTGESYVIPASADHFMVPSSDCVDLAVSSPGYNPDNQISTPEDSPFQQARLEAISHLGHIAILEA